jgi:IS605 OrfB family transposase
VCLHVDIPEVANDNWNAAVGIDLGLKTLATLSDGTKIENMRVLRHWAVKLAIAQRAGNKTRVRAIHEKIANIRRDHLHKATTALVGNYGFIAVGDVSTLKLVKTRMAKSVLDAAWGMFRSMLRYKCQKAGAVFVEVSERFTSQVCSNCGVNPKSSPKGMGGLGIREWECSACGSVHDRDVNAARNILRLGLSAQPRVDESRLLAA